LDSLDKHIFFTDFQDELFRRFGYTMDKLNPTKNYWCYNTLIQQRHFKEVGYHHYHLHYGNHFNDIRNDVKKVLEIGVFCGHSMLMWQRYFPNAEIYGIDIDFTSNHLGLTALDICKGVDRINLIEMDACDVDNVKKIESEIGNDFDIIIDDGSHHPMHQLFSLANYIELIKDDGHFVVEDIFLDYMYDNTFLNKWDKDAFNLFNKKEFFFNTLLSNDKIQLVDYGMKQTRYNPSIYICKLE
jgi:predicted O-methyltransferase YrrM